MSPHSASASNRKVIPIKRVEGEPLTRCDLQYDLLRNIFSDTHAVFTNPWADQEDSAGTKLTFRNIYIKTILHSTGATKAFREKLADSDVFAEDFAMLALLVNVGRINTTMSFFPEMKTAIRSYHPVPALQRTSGNLQDAPRIKHMLKAVKVESEGDASPNKPSDILSRLSSGHLPPTTVSNLIFALASHSTAIGQAHLPENVDFIDLFMKTDLSSESRARAFLWLCFHYLERPTPKREVNHDNDVIVNPFGDPGKDGKPTFVHLEPEDASLENVDPEDEMKLAEKLVVHRANLLQRKRSKEKLSLPPSAGGSVIGDPDDTPGSVGEEIGTAASQVKGKQKRENAPTVKKPRTTTKEPKSTPGADKMPKSRKQKATNATSLADPFDQDVIAEGATSSGRAGGTRRRVMDIRNQYPANSSQVPSSNNHQLSGDSEGAQNNYRYTPYQREHTSLQQSSEIYQTARTRHPVPPRSFLQHAWLRVTTVDPLVDSDDEDDEYTRQECMQRLRVIAGILGTPFTDSAPTSPPPAQSQPQPHTSQASLQQDSTHYSRYI